MEYGLTEVIAHGKQKLGKEREGRKRGWTGMDDPPQILSWLRACIGACQSTATSEIVESAAFGLPCK